MEAVVVNLDDPLADERFHFVESEARLLFGIVFTFGFDAGECCAREFVKLPHHGAKETFDVSPEVRLSDRPEVEFNPVTFACMPKHVTPELLCIVYVDAVHSSPARPVPRDTVL